MFKPTDEQTAIVDAAKTGNNLVIEAGAGAGKTSTLKLLAALGGQMHYIAYNKPIQLEAAATFPSNTTCTTAHGLGYRPVATRYVRAGRKVNGPRVRAMDMAKILRINEPIRITDGKAPLSPQQLARITEQTVSKFCKSGDDEITTWHTPYVPGVAEDRITRAALGDAILPFARRYWDDILNLRGQLRFEHDHYLKIFSLQKPILDVDVLLVDEAQDLNPAVKAIVDAQRCQVILVGDRCQPAGTLVTVVRRYRRGNRFTGIVPVEEQVPIEQLREGDKVVSFDIPKAFLRRSGSVVSGITARPFTGNLIRVTTEDGKTSAYTPDHHCVAQIAPALKGKHVLYLMRRGADYRMGVTLGLNESQGNRAGFMLRAHQEDADAVWVLDTFDTREEALAAEAMESWTHRVPQLGFVAGNRSTMTQETLETVWGKIGNNRAEAATVLTAYGRDIRHPLWRQGDDNLLIRQPTVVKATNLLDGMAVLTIDGAMDANGKRADRNRWVPVTVTREPYDGPVYSMTVENDHTYVGDSIITHNCQAINGWNGAIDAMETFEGKRLYLSQSFRFGDAIAYEANKWLTILDADLRLSGFNQVQSRVEELDAPDAILCRTNAVALGRVISNVEQGRRVALAGGGKDIIVLAEAARDLQNGRSTSHPELIAFSNWREVQTYAEEEGAGDNLQTLVRLVDGHGADTLIRTLNRLTDEKYADLIISTAHKSKGKEWNTVQVAEDFKEPKPSDKNPNPEITREAAMLAYVTVTRAKRILDRAGLAWVDNWLPGAPAAPAAAPVVEPEPIVIAAPVDTVDEAPADADSPAEEPADEALEEAFPDETGAADDDDLWAGFDALPAAEQPVEEPPASPTAHLHACANPVCSGEHLSPAVGDCSQPGWTDTTASGVVLAAGCRRCNQADYRNCTCRLMPDRRPVTTLQPATV